MTEKSIIWAASDSKVSFLDFSFINELNLNALININHGRKIGEPERDLREYFSIDKETLILREELFKELLENEALFESLKTSFSRLSDFFDIQREKESVQSNEQMLFSIKALETYVEYLTDIKRIFTENDIKCRALNNVWELIKPICCDSEFDRLCKAVKEQVHTISNIKSITVGINLNAQMQPTESGVITVNEQSYVSGDFLNRILRLKSNDDEFVCAAPLLPMNSKLSNEEMGAVRISVNSALNKVFASTLKSWSGIVKKFVINNLSCLSQILYEWKFVLACMQPLTELKNHGYSLCKPEFSDKDDVTGLYHPILAMTSLSKDNVIKNDIEFNRDNRTYILTGPNQGGKSIYTQSIGIMYAMLHLGMLLPASKVIICPVDAILVHFIDVKNRSYVHGRLSDECDKIHNINKVITDKSLFLFDEALSSTNASEAVVISTEIIDAYAEIGAKGIWTTHFHELCSLADSYTNKKSGICNISAQIDESSHKRIYKIVRGDSGKSYAMDIAMKYSLTKDEILKNRQKQ